MTNSQGDILSITTLGQTVVILNSYQAAIDMLDKKSSVYSDRPVLQMSGELCGWKDSHILLPYGERFRRERKMYHRTIGTPNAIKQYLPIEEQETRRLMHMVLENPDDLADHIR